MLTHAILLSALLVAPLSVPASGSGCDPKLAAVGLCGTNNNTEIIIDGTQDTPGDPGDSDTSTTDYTDPGTDLPWLPPTDFDFADCLDDWDSYIHCFRTSEEDEEKPDDDVTEPAIPDITITDVARFAPDGPVLTGEPDNVGVVGLPTNFVATASVHTVNGELFGLPVAVRFTPAAFDFAFGDDAAATTTSGGQSWEDLGQAQFTPTSTSHTYSDRGTYSANVDVRYTAEVDFGIGWFPISGEVTASGPMQEIRIFEAHTALVAHTCQQAPSSPGC